VRVKIITKKRNYREGNISDIIKFIDEILKTYSVIAPTKIEGKQTKFTQISSSTEILLNPIHQTSFSFKDWLLPRNQVLLQYNINKNDITIDDSVGFSSKKRILFGLHPCDLHSIQILDQIFLEEKDLDVHYKKLRENTLIIGLGCEEPFKNCFCASVNTLEPPDGTYDLFFYLKGKKFYVFKGSSEGADLIKKLKSKVSIDGEEQISLINKHIASAQKLKFPIDEDLGAKIKETYGSEFWDDLGKKCFGCAGCTIVCPTCYCFFVDDKVENDGKKKMYKRIRDWDSCTLNNWALAAGGHNFQNNRGVRLNRRFMHKFSQLKTKLGRIACVGCGRCIDICPTGASNPVNVIKDLIKFKK